MPASYPGAVARDHASLTFTSLACADNEINNAANPAHTYFFMIYSPSRKKNAPQFKPRRASF